MLQYQSPLKWPSYVPAVPLNKQRNDSGFSPNLNLNDALRFLDDEANAMGIAQATLYTDFEYINVERLRKKIGNRTGACLQIKYMGREYILTCDRWQKLEHNIYVLHLAFRNWCSMEKWGIGSVAALMAGFETDRTHEDMQNVEKIAKCLSDFGLGNSATLDDATAIYHRRARAMANDEEQLQKLNQSMESIRAYFSNNSTK
jgi:hypothetical protein